MTDKNICEHYLYQACSRCQYNPPLWRILAAFAKDFNNSHNSCGEFTAFKVKNQVVFISVYPSNLCHETHQQLLPLVKNSLNSRVGSAVALYIPMFQYWALWLLHMNLCLGYDWCHFCRLSNVPNTKATISPYVTGVWTLPLTAQCAPSSHKDPFSYNIPHGRQRDKVIPRSLCHWRGQ